MPQKKMRRAALRWLLDHGGSAVVLKDGTILGGGEISPYSRSDFHKLETFDMVVFVDGRITLTRSGVIEAEDFHGKAPPRVTQADSYNARKIARSIPLLFGKYER
jgi:hypothetical protein